MGGGWEFRGLGVNMCVYRAGEGKLPVSPFEGARGLRCLLCVVCVFKS